MHDLVQPLHLDTGLQGTSKVGECCCPVLCRYSASDEQGSRSEDHSMQDMHLAAGDVHLWWLFPEDVGSGPLSNCTIPFVVASCDANTQQHI